MVDLLVATVVLLLLSPLLVLVYGLIFLEDAGFPLFTQVRVGRENTRFVMYKFRSMRTGSGELPSAAAATLPVTRVGRYIRRANIDELPQLLNVIKGDMSLIGPRPSLPSQIVLNSLRQDNGAAKCRPGLTGLAQVSAYDGMTEQAKAALDGTYASRVTIRCDLKIVIRTLGYFARRPPIY